MRNPTLWRALGAALAVLGLIAVPATAQFAPPDPEGPVSPPSTSTSVGALNVSADHQEQTGTGSWVFDGNVRINYEDLIVEADRVEVDKDRRNLAAEGNVLVVSGQMRLSGARAEIDLDSKTGSVYEGYALLDPTVIVHGERLDKVGDQQFVLYDGEITACEQSVPQWSLRTSKAKIRIEGYARIRNARLKIKKVPFFYTPYLIWPVKRERSTGFLLPHFGSSQNRGSILSAAFYLVLGRSADATFYADSYSKAGVAPGLQLRYAPAEGTRGELYGFYLKDKRDDSESWKYTANHQQELGRRFRVVVNANVVKDEQYFEDFERNLSNFSNRTSFWSAYLSGNLSLFSLAARAEERDTFFTFYRRDAEGELVVTEDTITTSKLPELTVRQRETEILGPLTFGFEASLANVGRQVTSTDYDAEYGRADVHPELGLDLPLLPWLTITPRIGARYTRWTKSVIQEPVDPTDPTQGKRTVVLDEPVTRTYGEASLELIGPRFAKIWETDGDEDEKPRKRKHLIEPQITYRYISDIDELDQIPVGDSGDYVLPLNEVKYGIVSRLYVKRNFKDDPDPLKPPLEYHYIYDSACNCYQKRAKNSALQTDTVSSFGEQVFEAPPDVDETVHELFRVSLFQRYSLDPDLATNYGRRFNYQGNPFLPNEAKQQKSPVTLQANYFPTRYSTVSANVDYDFEQDSRLVRASLTANLRDRKKRWFELSFIENADYTQRQVRTSLGWHFAEETWRFELDQYWDLQNAVGDTGLRQQRYLVNYNAQCVGIIAEYSKFNFAGFDDYEIRVALVLPQVGTFLDLRRGSSGIFQGNNYGGGRGTPF